MYDFKYILMGDKERLECSGTTAELTAIVVRIINVIYAKTYQANRGAARAFRQVLAAAVMDPDGPVWDRTTNVAGNAIGVTVLFARRRKEDE